MNVSTAIFLASVGFILYVLAGYPLGLAIWSRLFSLPIEKQFLPQKLSIVIPVRNGARWIKEKIQSLLESDYPPELIDLLVVSDGSTDATERLVRQYPDNRVRLLALPPAGKAVAVTEGLQHVSSEIVVLTDVRQQFDPGALRYLVACFADPMVGVVTGELVIREGSTLGEYNTGLYWKYEKWIRGNLNRIDGMLGATGSIYAIRRKIAAPIPPDILLDDVYLPFKAASIGYRIYFEQQAKAYDLPTSLRSEFRRKVRTQAGIYQIVRHFPALLWPGNHRFLHFLSHKIGRLMLPFAMVVVALSSLGLPHPWRSLALAFQCLFYLAAIADPLIPEANPIKRLSGVIRAYVSLLIAAFCSLAVFLVPARRLWKETQVGTAHE